MDEDLSLAHDSAKSVVSPAEDEKEKVKDFVYRHFREVTDGSLFGSAEEPSLKDYGSTTRREKPAVNKSHCKIQQGAVFSGKILSFECSVCKDGSTYSPNDLLKHFRASHKGTLPTYPCDLCSFFTNEFPALQRHRIEHRNTLVTCELCDDGVQYSLLLLTRHYIMCHSLNGQFSCDWCEFTTVDAGTFVQHIHHHNESPWKCSKCRHISLNEDEHQKHLKAHCGTFPFTCPFCGYGAARSEYLKKHIAAVHGDTTEKSTLCKSTEAPSANSSSGIKPLLKKGELQEAPRISKLSCLSSNMPNQNGRINRPEISLDNPQLQLDGSLAKKDKTWNKLSVSSQPSGADCDVPLSSDAAAQCSPNGLTVLMVKNKISLPRNCTTKVMGFKMVEGKKHLVLKVIPACKQDSSDENGSAVEDVGSSAQATITDRSKSAVENGDVSHSRSSKPCSVSPRGGSCLQMDQDEIMTVKVKIEEEETSVCSMDFPSQRDALEEQINVSVTRSSTSMHTLYPLANEPDQSDQTSPSNNSQLDNSNTLSINGPILSNTSTVCNSSVTRPSAPLRVSHKNLLLKHLTRKTVENCSAAGESLLNDTDADRHLNTADHEDSRKTPENQNHANNKNTEVFKHVSVNVPSSEPSSPHSLTESDESLDNSKLSPNQEVFSFHNYSKESFSTFPNTTQNSDDFSENSDDEHGESFRLSLAESPEHAKSSSEEDLCHEEVRKLSESEAEVDESASDESVLQNFNIIKIEEESIPISRNQSEGHTASESKGSFMEEHSDASLTQQLHRDKAGPLSSGNDSVKPPKTTLRILQLPEGKQQVLLRTSENRFTVPVQVKASPGFKLITSSKNPQINVSYMTPGPNGQSNPAVTPHRTGVAATNAGAPDRGAAQLSAVPSGLSSASNHFFVNSPGLKGPVLLSSTPQNTPADRRTQPTCYLVQRSVPLVQTNSTPGLRLASTPLPLNSRPVLAMPVKAADKPLQAGRQAFLLRYISPSKSGFLLNPEAKNGTQNSQNGESTANKVIFKIVTPSGSLLTPGAPTSSSQPLFLATGPQAQCFLLSASKSNANASSSVKKLISVKTPELTEPNTSPYQVDVQVPNVEKPVLAPRPIRPPSQRKRRRKTLFDELPETVHKARRLSNRAAIEKESTLLWTPAAKDVERTLRLSPFSRLQPVRCPRRYQPVVVLNHPDGDIPEVSGIMKVVRRHKGAVTKVVLSQRTIQALAVAHRNSLINPAYREEPRLAMSSVQERFILKMKLRKKSRRKYEVLDTLAGHGQETSAFTCWFCGRLFNSQEDWIGHGQRHLMEATRDWNQLF